MIAYLKWEVVDLDFNKAVLLTESGVGYEVWITDITYAEIAIWSHIEFFVYHHITENNQSLFGFLEKADKQVFEELIKISWIWWKVALQILSLWVARLSQAVRDDDKKTIVSIKGIGKKMAEKIVLELKDKDFIDISISSNKDKLQTWVKLDRDINEWVKSTLSAMWYNPKDIDRVLDNLPEGLEEVGEIITFVIRKLS